VSRALKSLAIFFAFVAIYTLSRHAITSSSTTTSVTTPVSSSTSVTTTTSPKSEPCKGSDFSAVYNQGEGAAGTITASVTLTKATPGWCSMKGWPILTLQDKSGAVLRSSTVDTSTNPPVQYQAPAASQAPALLTLLQGSKASFSLAYSDVPTGSETSCPAAVTMSVQIVAGGTTVTVTPQYPLQPCNNGQIYASPFYKGL
jgi:hypothetical protein